MRPERLSQWRSHSGISTRCNQRNDFRIDVRDQLWVEREDRRGYGSPVIVHLAGSDAAALAEIHGARQGVERFSLEQAPAHVGAKLRLGHVLQHELGLKYTAEFAIASVETVRGLETVQALKRCGPGGVASRERGVELTDADPLLGDEAEVHRSAPAPDHRFEDTVVARRVGAVDALWRCGLRMRGRKRIPITEVPKVGVQVDALMGCSVVFLVMEHMNPAPDRDCHRRLNSTPIGTPYTLRRARSVRHGVRARRIHREHHSPGRLRPTLRPGSVTL